MSLKLYKRPSGIWHIRGTVQGERFDQSARTRSRSEAEQIRAKAEGDAFRRSVYGERSVATFADAALGYLGAGGDATHMGPLLDAFGTLRLSEVTQAALDRLAASRRVSNATLIRQVYTPAGAILNFAASSAGGRLCEKPDFRKPSVRAPRTDYLTPDQAEAWIGALPPHLSRLVVFYLATGCRASEALGLEWKDVSVGGERVVFWDTKSNYARGVDLQRRAREAIGPRCEGPVFRNSRGQSWHGYDAINLMLRKELVRNSYKLPPVHCHLFRHTWATWAYAATRDLTFVMQQGGWRSLKMVERYTHVGSPDLARAVRRAGWEFQGREIFGVGRKRR